MGATWVPNTPFSKFVGAMAPMITHPLSTYEYQTKIKVFIRKLSTLKVHSLKGILKYVSFDVKKFLKSLSQIIELAIAAKKREMNCF